MFILEFMNRMHDKERSGHNPVLQDRSLISKDYLF